MLGARQSISALLLIVNMQFIPLSRLTAYRSILNPTGPDLPGSLGACDTMVARRESTDDPFRAPVFLKNVNSGAGDWAPDISADGCTLFFNRTSAPRGDIWVATRKKEDDDFGSPVRLPPQVNFPSCSNYFPNLSSDGSTLYFASNFPSVSGDWELCQVSISPVVDFNGDEVIDLQDIVIMTEHWGENYPLCDIGPTPFGDGIVDIQDLVVLTEYIEPIDSTLIAHWALDEAEGAVAYDSAGVNDGILNGGPLWQPTTGQIDGALVFDGTDDYISTLFVLNSEDGPFSVFAWIKGGAPGQAVLSQIGGVNWLRADTLEGNLMTELKPDDGAYELRSVLCWPDAFTSKHHRWQLAPDRLRLGWLVQTFIR